MRRCRLRKLFPIISYRSPRVHISSSNKFQMLFDNHGCVLVMFITFCRRGSLYAPSPVFVKKANDEEENSFQIHKTFVIYLLCVSLFPVSGPETAENEEDDEESERVGCE